MKDILPEIEQARYEERQKKKQQVEWLLNELDRIEKEKERAYKELGTYSKEEYEAWVDAITYFRYKIKQTFADVFEEKG